MARFFYILAIAGVVAAQTGCNINVLNVNNAVIGNGCVPPGSQGNIPYMDGTASSIDVTTTSSCGVSPIQGRQLRPGLSLQVSRRASC
jgi:hypothetical protein